MESNKNVTANLSVYMSVCVCCLWLWPRKAALHLTPSIKYNRWTCGSNYSAKCIDFCSRFEFTLRQLALVCWYMVDIWTQNTKSEPLFFFFFTMSRKILICGLALYVYICAIVVIVGCFSAPFNFHYRALCNVNLHLD